MMISPTTIQQAWHSFTTHGSCDETLVAPPVLRSWMRCAALELDPSYNTEQITKDKALTRNAAQEALLALARPFMEDLYQFVEGSGFAVLLFDTELMLIELIGDDDICESIYHLGLGTGSSWCEHDVGTLAVNLTLHEAIPCQTRGAEHYYAVYQQFACSAAPLFDVQGQAVGSIGVLGPEDSAHQHTLGMVIATAQAIQTQVRNNLLLSEVNDHLSELNAAIEAMSEGMIVLDVQLRVRKMNSRAGHLLSLSPRSAAGRAIDTLIKLPDQLHVALEQRHEFADQELVFGGRKGPVAVICSAHPIWDRGRRYLGALITIRSPETVQRLVQQVVGVQARFTFDDLIGESSAMQAVVRQSRIAAKSYTPVLIQGEVGVGKELCAHAIHNGGMRANEPFVVLNCAAMPRTLLLDELLGYERKQDARNTEGRPGKLELARGGTLMLEEVCELTIEAQTSLLRAIETRSLIRMGGQRVIPLDVRIIATTDHDLEIDVAEGRFRADLFYRLSVLTIHIPPLRVRGNDILMIIDRLLSGMNQHMGKQVLLAPEALAALVAYMWPGNVRELETTLERLLHMTEKHVLTLDDLPRAIVQKVSPATEISPSAHPPRLYDRHAIAERDAILRAGRETAGHLGRTAQRLGVSRATLWRKMKLYGIQKDQFWQS
ncbi:MAG: hypothetical protein GFH27_549297n232 [Chloroflexi bacterium AL-W]|nr:hypothetical protein [Chloroflexi bacterium AL-N1]NOK68915.1 hypothetical protein [Chloroflexi bacterium AL-N10]NOK76898.1 hypothetical protein [Chloroflexi bacterium AL-N5]NOK82714.1 hypothetical protein [Chloroflexi bacterium AL-W]NOK90755.1 hypothetical protein [Chloroflexi bacterium AL-N15]